MTKAFLQSVSGAMRSGKSDKSFEQFQPKAKRCKCRYTSDPSTGLPEALLDQGKYFPDVSRKTVSVDRCIATVIEQLWAAGVRTGACCCGHNGTQGLKRPHVMITDPAQAQLAYEIIKSDPREWWVSFWAGNVKGK